MGGGYVHPAEKNNLADATLYVYLTLTRVRKISPCSGSQFSLDLDDGRNTIGAVGIRNGGILFGGIVAEQEHLFGIEGVFGPGDV